MTVLPNHWSDFIPDIIEEEATKNGNDDYIMTEIHETTFEMKFKSDSNCHDELPGVSPAKLDFSGQNNQVILGLRENSIEAYWRDLNGIRTRIQNQNGLDRPEYVNIKTSDTKSDRYVEIKYMFDNPDAAVSHFEFTFKLRI